MPEGEQPATRRSPRQAWDDLLGRADEVQARALEHPLTLRAERSMPGRTLRNYLDDDVDGLAGMLAYNALFSLMPVLAAVSLIVGIVVQNSSLREDISSIFTDEMPESLGEPVVATVDTGADNTEGAGLITFVALLFGGSRLYSALDRAFARVYRAPRRGYFERRLFALLVAPAFSIVLVMTTLASAVATSFISTSLDRYIDLDINFQDFFTVYLVAFLLGFVMSLISYASIPVGGAGWRGSIPGAAAAGLMFVLLSQLYPIYISLTGGYNIYGAVFGLVLLFMFWLYLAAQIMIIGAEINAVTSGARERNVRQAS